MYVLGYDADFNQHVADLEEWNEDAGFVWGVPTVIHGNVITVVHPFTEPADVAGGKRDTTAIAVYTHAGDPLALWIIATTLVDGKMAHRSDHNYWG